jgi:hypothetical protein
LPAFARHSGEARISVDDYQASSGDKCQSASMRRLVGVKVFLFFLS